MSGPIQPPIVPVAAMNRDVDSAAISTMMTAIYTNVLITGTGLADGVIDNATGQRATITAAVVTLCGSLIGDLQARVAYLEQQIIGTPLR